MASTNDNREPPRPRYKLESYVTSPHDNNSRFIVRRNGKLFHITVSPSEFIDSPTTTQKYLSYLEVLRSGEEVIGDVYGTDVYEWVTRPFESLFAELAPTPVQSDDGTDITVTLKQYLFPDFFLFALDIVDEKPQPRRIKSKSSFYTQSCLWLDEDDLDELETWIALYDPAGIVLSFDNPEDALFKLPRKVLIGAGQTACFFKPCQSSVQTKNELQAYMKIASADLDPNLRLCRLFGVVMDDLGSIAGLLLTYIDHGGHTLSTDVDPNHPSASIRKRWMDELEATLTALDKVGIVWGDVKAENVLVDREDNVWITDFGGGYTEGWVEKDMAGTVEGESGWYGQAKRVCFPRRSTGTLMGPIEQGVRA